MVLYPVTLEHDRKLKMCISCTANVAVRFCKSDVFFGIQRSLREKVSLRNLEGEIAAICWVIDSKPKPMHRVPNPARHGGRRSGAAVSFFSVAWPKARKAEESHDK